MIERAPRQFTAQRVEIVVIQCDFSILMDGIADISFAARPTATSTVPANRFPFVSQALKSISAVPEKSLSATKVTRLR